jgi:CRISPR-associated protein Cas5 subtype I-C
MPYGIKLLVSGDHACFTRPEMKVERVSYDVMTPSAARGILEAIHWKPAIRWVIDKIHVLKPIRFKSIRRNEVGSKVSARNVKTAMNRGSLEGLHLLADEDRQQRASTVLADVAYLIEAHFEMTQKAAVLHAASASTNRASAHESLRLASNCCQRTYRCPRPSPKLAISASSSGISTTRARALPRCSSAHN